MQQVPIPSTTVCGFFPNAQSFFLMDDTSFTINQTQTGNPTLRLPSPPPNPTSHYHFSNGILVQSSFSQGLYTHSFRDLKDITPKSFTVKSDLQLRDVYCYKDAEIKALFYITENGVVWVVREGRDGAKEVINLEGRVSKKIQVGYSENSFYVYVLFEDLRGRDLATYKVSISNSTTNPYHAELLLIEREIYDFVLYHNNEIVRLIKRTSFYIDNLDTQLKEITGSFKLQALPVKRKIQSIGKTLNEGIAFGLVVQTRDDMDVFLVYEDKLYKPEHSATAVGRSFTQQLQIGSDGLTHIIYWIEDKGLKVSQSKFPQFSKPCQQIIASNIANAFNQQGILNLFLEAPLLQFMGLETFAPAGIGSLYMLIHMVKFHVKKFSRALFATENKLLNSHSNFKRFNKFTEIFNNKIVQAVKKLLNEKAPGESYLLYLRYAQNLQYFQNQMTAKVVKQYDQYLEFENHRDRTVETYKKSIQEYKENLYRIQSVLLVLLFIKNYPDLTQRNALLQDYITRRSQQIRNILTPGDNHKKNLQKQTIVLYQDYMLSTSRLDWTTHKPTPQSLLCKSLNTHPLQTTYYLTGILPPSTNFQLLFTLDQQTQQIARTIRRLQQPCDFTTSYLQFIARTQTPIPELTVLFLCWVAIARQMNGLAVGILEGRRLEEHTREVIEVYVKAGKLEAGYLMVRNYMKELLGDVTCGRGHWLGELIDQAASEKQAVPLLKLMMVMDEGYLPHTLESLQKLGINIKQQSITRL